MTVPPVKLLRFGVSPQGPEQLPEYCDSRLRRLNVPFWTRVPASTEFVARALSRWLYSYHAFECFFDMDLFISDLVSKRQTYCSPLLVNAVMYIACVSPMAHISHLISSR